MDPLKFVIPDAVELKSGTYRGYLRDENNGPVGVATLSSLTLTLYDQASGTIINSRNVQNVLNANQVTVDTAGLVTWIWVPLDMQILNPNKPVEIHIAVFEAKWSDSGGRPRQLNHEVWFHVNRITNVV